MLRCERDQLPPEASHRLKALLVVLALLAAVPGYFIVRERFFRAGASVWTNSSRRPPSRSNSPRTPEGSAQLAQQRTPTNSDWTLRFVLPPKPHARPDASLSNVPPRTRH
jgi:hypothetical protein